MIRGWPQSLQVRLALRVAALYIVATVVVIVVLMSRAYDTARSFGDQELLLRADDLARHVTAGESGLPHLEMLPSLSAIYQLSSGRDIFAIRDANGRVIAAAPPRFGELVAGWSRATSEPVRFDVRLDTEPGDLDGLTISRETVTGLVSIWVGRSSAGATALYSLMRKFIHDTIWAVSILVLASLVVGILSVSVADRGPGIIPADQERIFDRFWRGKGVQFEGAGLGLAIVKEIMNAHGGRVSVENRSPDGVIFTLHFTIVRDVAG